MEDREFSVGCNSSDTNKSQRALLTLKRRIEREGVSMAYKVPRSCISWRCGHFNTPSHVWQLLAKHESNKGREMQTKKNKNTHEPTKTPPHEGAC